MLTKNVLIFDYHECKESLKMPLKLHVSLISFACIYWKPNEVKTMVLVSIALLSLLRSESDSGKAYIPLGLEDQEDLEIFKRVLVIR